MAYCIKCGSKIPWEDSYFCGYCDGTGYIELENDEWDECRMCEDGDIYPKRCRSCAELEDTDGANM